MEEILCYTYEAALNAKIDFVFECLDKDEHVLKWNTQIVENIYDGDEKDLTEGSTYITRQKIGKKVFEVTAKYSKYDPPNLAVVETETKEGISKVEYRLEETTDSTRFTVNVYMIPANWLYKLAVKLFKGSVSQMYDEQFDRFVDYVHEQVR